MAMTQAATSPTTATAAWQPDVPGSGAGAVAPRAGGFTDPFALTLRAPSSGHAVEHSDSREAAQFSSYLDGDKLLGRLPSSQVSSQSSFVQECDDPGQGLDYDDDGGGGTEDELHAELDRLRVGSDASVHSGRASAGRGRGGVRDQLRRETPVLRTSTNEDSDSGASTVRLKPLSASSIGSYASSSSISDTAALQKSGAGDNPNDDSDTESRHHRRRRRGSGGGNGSGTGTGTDMGMSNHTASEAPFGYDVSIIVGGHSRGKPQFSVRRNGNIVIGDVSIRSFGGQIFHEDDEDDLFDCQLSHHVQALLFGYCHTIVSWGNLFAPRSAPGPTFMQRCGDELFSCVREGPQDGSAVAHLVRVACGLVDTGQVWDLLSSSSDEPLPFFDAATGVSASSSRASDGGLLDQLTEHAVVSSAGLVDLVDQVTDQRVALFEDGVEGNMLFVLTVERSCMSPSGETSCSTGKLMLLDVLASQDIAGPCSSRSLQRYLTHLGDGRVVGGGGGRGVGGSGSGSIQPPELQAALSGGARVTLLIHMPSSLTAAEATERLELGQAVKQLQFAPREPNTDCSGMRLAEYELELQNLDRDKDSQTLSAESLERLDARRQLLQSRILRGGDMAVVLRLAAAKAQQEQEATTSRAKAPSADAATSDAALLALVQDPMRGPCSIAGGTGPSGMVQGNVLLSWLVTAAKQFGEPMEVFCRLVGLGAVRAVGTDAAAGQKLAPLARYHVATQQPSQQTAAHDVHAEGFMEGMYGPATMDEFGSTEPLHAASLRGDRRTIVRLLSQAQFPVDFRDHGGRTPLMYAAIGNQTRTCELLLKRFRTNVNAVDSNGQTALLWVAAKGAADTMRVLLRHGADVSHVDNGGRTSFHWASKLPDTRCLSILAQCAGSTIVDHLDSEQLSALHWAVMVNNADHEAILIQELKANVHAVDGEGRTALSYAVLNYSHDCLRVFLDLCHPSLVNQADHKGRSPLHLACSEGCMICVRALCSYRGCNLNCQDERLTSPLHWAVVTNRPEIVQVLIEAGAHPGVVDANGMTPLQHAEHLNHAECVFLLQAYQPVDVPPRFDEEQLRGLGPTSPLLPALDTTPPHKSRSWLGCASPCGTKHDVVE